VYHKRPHFKRRRGQGNAGEAELYYHNNITYVFLDGGASTESAFADTLLSQLKSAAQVQDMPRYKSHSQLDLFSISVLITKTTLFLDYFLLCPRFDLYIMHDMLHTDPTILLAEQE
jgi:hypothetical protein